MSLPKIYNEQIGEIGAHLDRATPVQIDTLLYALYSQALDLRLDKERAVTSLRHVVGDKHDYYRKTWGLTYDEVIAKATHLAQNDTTYVGGDASKGLNEVYRIESEQEINKAAQRPLHTEYSRRPWTRTFLVTDGHVHRSMECSTCFPTTAFTWLVDLSGKDEAEIVELAGERACTVCYPTAPTLRSFEKASPLFTEEEAERNRQREIRAAEKAARTEQKIAKGLTHDGSEFVCTWVETNARCTRYNPETRTNEYYVGDRTHTERFKTEKAAVQWVVQQLAWQGQGNRYEHQRPAWDAIVEAVATKHGRALGTVWEEIHAKVAAKIKRDNRGY